MTVEAFALAPGIFVYKNVLKNPSKLIETVESAVNQKIISWAFSSIEGDFEGVYKNIRDTLEIEIPYVDSYTSNILNSLLEVEKEISTEFLKSFKLVEDHYRTEFNLPFNNHEQYRILKYGVGQKFTDHVDDTGKIHRRISTVCYLNDDYEGGEILFPRFNLTYKPKKNEMLIFPSFYVYNHSVSEVLNGTRYSVVSWISL